MTENSINRPAAPGARLELMKSLIRKTLALSVLGLPLLAGTQALAETSNPASVDRMAMTQKSVLEQLLRDNAEARFSRLQTDIAGTQVDFQSGFYQPSLFSSLRYSDQQIANTAEDEATGRLTQGNTTTFDEQRAELEFGAVAPLITGAELSLSFTGIERDNTYTEELSPGVSEYVGGVDLNFRQPLWRNLMARETELAIDQAEAGFERAGIESRQTLLEVAFQGLRQYWLTHRRAAFRAIDETALETAEDTVAIAEQLVDAGIQPALAAMEVEAQVIEREAELRRSTTALAEAQAELATLLNIEQSSQALIEPVDAPEDRLIERPASLTLYATRVLGQWPEFRATRLSRKIEQFQLDLARETGKPAVDLVLGYSTSALDRDSSEVWDDSFTGRYPSWYVGFEVNVKLGADQQAEAQANAASMRMMQADIDAESVRVNVLNRLSTRLEQAESAHEQMQLMQRREALQQAIYDEQERRFEAGQIPANALHDAMDDLIDVQRKAVDARVAYQLALIALRLVEGSLFAEYGLEDLVDEFAVPANPPRLEFVEASNL